MAQPATEDPILGSLTPEQRQAASHESGPLLIVAGPGSGKTRVITHRIAWLIQARQVHPSRILAVTFTRKASGEMRQRAYNLTKGRSAACIMRTFHSFGAELLRTYPKEAGLNSGFSIFDDSDQRRLVNSIVKSMDLNIPSIVGKARHAISSSKQKGITPEQVAREADMYHAHDIALIYAKYEQELRNANAVDFDDLLLKPVRLLSANELIRNECQQRFQFIMVDEFQDTNPLQLRLCTLITDQHRNICVVGDPDQSIYSWRHADIRNILDFEKHFPNAKRVFLTQTFRSTGTILDAASRLIGNNRQRFKSKQLWTSNGRGAPLMHYEAYNEEEEAQFALRQIQQLSTKHKLTQMAVMCRTTAQFRVLEKVFTAAGMPYELVGGTPFYERAEIKDMLAYLRVLANPSDGVALERIINTPRRGIGAKALAQLLAVATRNRISAYRALTSLLDPADDTAAELKASAPLHKFAQLLGNLKHASAELHPSDLLKHIYTKSGYEQMLKDDPEEDAFARQENVEELIAFASTYKEGAPEQALFTFLGDVTLDSEPSTQEQQETAQDQDKLTLITMHRSKGLEYEVVFLLGMEQGLMPHQRSLENPGELEEERRLCYVAITRSSHLVYLTHARMRLMRYGMGAMPSEFLAELPHNLVKTLNDVPQRQAPYSATVSPAPPNALPSYRAGASQQEEPPEPQDEGPELFEGDRVRHPTLGEAVVMGARRIRGGDAEIMLKFAGGEQKRFMLSVAKLERIAEDP